MTLEEIERLDKALEPVRKEAYESGFEYGSKQGVMNVYIGLLNLISDEMNEDERKATAAMTSPIREWMKKTWPHIDEYFNRK